MMNVSRFRMIACFALCCSMFGSALVAQMAPVDHSTRRIYVEPFVTKEGSEKFREDVIAELRKLNSVSLAGDESSADVILGGGGEVWIKGYRSHNPQLGKVAPNGTPIYTGFLSIELRDRNGQTLWSYLATPPAASGDILKDLSTLIAKKLADALRQGDAPSRTTPLPQPTTTLKGAGATFPFPVYQKWFTSYRRENPALDITYEPIGSAAGVRSLLANSVDFGASDSPEVIHELSPGDDEKYLFFPSVVGAVVPVVNLPGLSGDIAFTPEALAGIYQGKITKWNDPILTRANRGLRLPDLNIVVVHRADGSGTSYAWTDYLSKTSSEWKTQVGASLAPKWPIGREASGNDGVSKLVKEQNGAIGYVEFIYALQNHLSYGRVRNRDGEFVAASLESIAAAVSHSVKLSGDFKVSIVDSPGAGVYPISSFTWIVVPTHIADDAKRNALTGFLHWMAGPAQRQAAALGYLPIPKDVAVKEEAAIAKIH
ncbi:phosphate ABC transporter substrate-binding protein PstS [Acidicapsa acidisoli]|uniref:phosphate ABC transporter substrate-binding protein PstS n=1 Tax=Acidicapsa acidisoli TaxID=1615681 RepID=UPI0021E07127|nr:phosphate ABC transporter substrate-binding protein PstS [Acidicapsa acidisoli]